MNNSKLLDEIIKGLNADLSREYTATIQYIQHSAKLTGAQYFAIIDELEAHANDEKEHSITLSHMIDYLGGDPTVEIGEVLTSNDDKEMLLQDLQYEYYAIRCYNERIRQLEVLGLYDLSQQIRNIAAEEQEHAHDLEISLGIRKDHPTIPSLLQVYDVAPPNCDVYGYLKKDTF